MTSTQDEGVYTKTAAYNFLKRLLGIQPKDTINRKIFDVCFTNMEHVYRPKKRETEITEIFNRHQIPERNKLYWDLKKQQQAEKAKEVFKETVNLLEKEFKTAA